MKSIPPAVITLWMPAFFLLGLYLFLGGQPLQHWSVYIMIVPLLAYMNTLADLHKSDGRIRIRRWWGSIYIRDEEILEISPSALDGISRMRLRRFVPPWGIIYFVPDWSSVALSKNKATARTADQKAEFRDLIPNLLAPVLLFLSGLIVGRVAAADSPALWITTPTVTAAALTASGALLVLFCVTRKNRPVLANVLLFSASLTAALVWGAPP